MNPRNLKIVGIIAILFLVANALLFAFGVIGDAIFWVVIVIAAIFVYYVLPKLKS